MKIEYKVRPVTRYVVTRFEDLQNGETACIGRGEYDNADMAYEVGYALAREEHERLGYPEGDMRIIYPEHPIETQGLPLSDAVNRTFGKQNGISQYIKSQL